MFDYPLPFDRKNAYTRIGVTPEATAAEIREAKSGIIRRLNQRKHFIERRLSEIYGKIPELKTTREKLVQATGESGERNQQALLRKCRRLEAEAQGLETDFTNMERESRQIDARISELNNTRLETTEERHSYDITTPPCALLKLMLYQPPVLFQRRVMLYKLRRVLSTFLEDEKGVACFHPSDLTRRFFLSDFEAHPLLDEEKS